MKINETMVSVEKNYWREGKKQTYIKPVIMEDSSGFLVYCLKLGIFPKLPETKNRSAHLYLVNQHKIPTNTENIINIINKLPTKTN